MKRPVIVVEGVSDVNKLTGLVDADFVTTNGSCVSRETIEYIKELSKTRKIIVLTDPDYPGMRIRSILQNEIPEALNAYVKKELSIKGKKLGVCECYENEILRAINEVYKWGQSERTGNLNFFDLYKLGLTGENSVSRRDFLANKIPIGKTNGKTLLKRLNQLNITLSMLESLMKEYENDSK